jgi:hypothetical protein
MKLKQILFFISYLKKNQPKDQGQNKKQEKIKGLGQNKKQEKIKGLV